KSRLGIVLMNETVRRRRLDRLDDLSNLVDVDLVRELSPEDDARRRKAAPDRARGFYAREPRHLNIEHAQFRSMLERELDCLFAVSRFDDRQVRRELPLEEFAQVATLGHVVFGYEYRHFTSLL